MTTGQIVLLVIVVLVLLGAGLLCRLYYCGGSNLNELEDELWPERDCCGWVKKNYDDLKCECRKAQDDEITKSGTGCLIT